MITLKPFNTFLYGLYLWNDNPYMVLNRLIIPPMGVDWLTYNWWRAITVGMSKYTYSIRLMIVLWGGRVQNRPINPQKGDLPWSWNLELKPCDNTALVLLQTTSTSNPFNSVPTYIYIYYMKNAVRLQVYHVKTCYCTRPASQSLSQDLNVFLCFS